MILLSIFTTPIFLYFEVLFNYNRNSYNYNLFSKIEKHQSYE